MARKGQKYIKHSEEIKKAILDEYNSGEGTPGFLAKKYNISVKTIENWIYKTRAGKNILIDTRSTNSGRFKEENIDYKEKYEILKKYLTFIEARRKIK